MFAPTNTKHVASRVFHRLALHAAALAMMAWAAACVPVATPPATLSTPLPTATTQPLADVINVTVGGDAGAYQFAVEIASPDTGCEQYADWWEVLADDGALLYRRILTHSHVDEQPFTRSGGPVAIAPETEVWVRAHLYPAGYGGRAMRGSVAGGFVAALPPPAWVTAPTSDLPRPDCAF